MFTHPIIKFAYHLTVFWYCSESSIVIHWSKHDNHRKRHGSSFLAGTGTPHVSLRTCSISASSLKCCGYTLLAVFAGPTSPVLPTSKRRSMAVESKIRKILGHAFIKRTCHLRSIAHTLMYVQETRPYLLGIWQDLNIWLKSLLVNFWFCQVKRAWFTYQTAWPGLLTLRAAGKGGLKSMRAVGNLFILRR